MFSAHNTPQVFAQLVQLHYCTIYGSFQPGLSWLVIMRQFYVQVRKKVWYRHTCTRDSLMSRVVACAGLQLNPFVEQTLNKTLDSYKHQNTFVVGSSCREHNAVHPLCSLPSYLHTIGCVILNTTVPSTKRLSHCLLFRNNGTCTLSHWKKTIPKVLTYINFYQPAWQ